MHISCLISFIIASWLAVYPIANIKIPTIKRTTIIKRFEGCRLKAYKCPAGVWTIGYGRTQGVKQGDVITQEQADSWLRYDLKVFELHVKNNLKYKLNQNQFDALVSFTYNCGLKNLKTLIKNRNLEQMGNDFKESNFQTFKDLFNEIVSIMKIIDQLKLDEKTGL